MPEVIILSSGSCCVCGTETLWECDECHTFCCNVHIVEFRESCELRFYFCPDDAVPRRALQQQYADTSQKSPSSPKADRIEP